MEKSKKVKKSKKQGISLSKRSIAALVIACLGMAFLGSYIFAAVFLPVGIVQPLSGGGRIIVPAILDVYPTQIEWGRIKLDQPLTASDSQTIQVKNKGLVPLRLQAFAVDNTVTPDWLQQDYYYLLAWTADGFVLGAHETINSTFKLLLRGYDIQDYMISHNMTSQQGIGEFDFSFDIKMDAATPQSNSTLVQYCSNLDYDAALLIADNQSLPLIRGLNKVFGIKDPAVYDPLYDTNNIIALGGWITNPYVAYYFTEYHVENGKLAGGPGISADGLSVIATKTRVNGYNITAVFGMTAADTLVAARTFIGTGPAPAVQYTLTISPSLNGTTTPAAGTYMYNAGTSKSVAANPDIGNEVDHWILDGNSAGAANPIQVQMNSNHTLACIFKPGAPPVTGPTIRIIPQSSSGTVGSTITFNVSVNNVADLFTWQILVNYTGSILNCTGATLPTDHVFAGQTFIPVTPIIDNVAGSVTDGLTLMTGSFSGNGTLCQLQFKVLAIGTCAVKFSTPYGADTFLLDSNLSVITAQTINGTFDNR
jgi:hypothetical protein